MSTQTLSLPLLPTRSLAPIATFFRMLAQAIAASSTAQARLDRVRRLQALDDAALAKMGLDRDDIVRHVFADVMGF
jgi:hypothetical protein